MWCSTFWASEITSHGLSHATDIPELIVWVLQNPLVTLEVVILNASFYQPFPAVGTLQLWHDLVVLAAVYCNAHFYITSPANSWYEQWYPILIFPHVHTLFLPTVSPSYIDWDQQVSISANAASHFPVTPSMLNLCSWIGGSKSSLVGWDTAI